MKENETMAQASKRIDVKTFLSDMALNQISIAECCMEIEHVEQARLSVQMLHIIDSCKKYVIE